MYLSHINFNDNYMPSSSTSSNVKFNNIFDNWFLIIIGIISAIILGLVSSTGSLILVTVAFAGILTIALAFKPIWIINIIIFFGLLVAGVVPLWTEGVATKAVWGISLLGFILMALAIFRLIFKSNPSFIAPKFVTATLIFIVYALINSLIQWQSADVFFGGFKRYFQVSGLLFAFAALSIDFKNINRFIKFFIIVALFQLPWVLYELIKLVPIRESIRAYYPGLIPIDIVAGTFGSNLYTGGANAEMVAFGIIILAFFLARYRLKLISNISLLWLLPILAPLFLGETKVVVLLFPLLFSVLYRKEILKRPVFALIGMFLCLALTLGALFTYASISGKPLSYQIDDVVKYNLQDKGYGLNVLNRTTVLSFWAKRQGLEDPTGAVFGHGLGAAHTATGGYLSRSYPGYGIDLSVASTLLWEQGLVGLILFIGIFLTAWRKAGNLSIHHSRPEVRADASAIQAVLPIFAFYLIYRVGLLESMPFQIVFYSLLGYLAWMCRPESSLVPNKP